LFVFEHVLGSEQLLDCEQLLNVEQLLDSNPLLVSEQLLAFKRAAAAGMLGSIAAEEQFNECNAV